MIVAERFVIKIHIYKPNKTILMRRILSVLLLIVAVLWSGSTNAKPVDKSTALRVAQNYCAQQGANHLQLVDISEHLPYREFYTFVGDNGKGFVLVSADDCVLPILGFSANNIFAIDNMPIHVREWLDDYEEQISFHRSLTEQHTNIQVTSTWNDLLGENPPMPPQHTSVAPLLRTEWGQDPLYNDLCPYDSTRGERTVAGCVAVSMAQVMKYWGHPTTGYGSHSYTHPIYGTQSANFASTTYEWDSMPNTLGSLSSPDEVNAIATLLYHAGVAVEMDYGLASEDGSLAYNNNEGALPSAFGTPLVPSAENALRYYFKYRSNIHHVIYSDLPNATWISILENEMNNSRPVIYFGRDASAGHSFICDGYNESGLFHFNWGWHGYYNGYFAIGNLNPGGSGTGGNSTNNYSNRNSAIFSIRPNADFGDTTTVTALTNTGSSGYGTVSGSGIYTGANDTLVTVTAIAAEGCRFTLWTDAYRHNPRTFYANGGSYTFRANFAPLTGDTLGYCNTRFIASYGASGTTVWGIKIPPTCLTPNHNLNKVLMYIRTAGRYTLKVYTGNTPTPTLVHTQSFTASSNMVNQWRRLTLSSNVPVDGTQPIWIMLESSVSSPAAVTYYAGNDDSRVWGSNFNTFNRKFSFMIMGVFTDGSSSGSITYGDTVSYCDTNSFATAMGSGSPQPFDWAVKLPATMTRHRSYVTDVMLYVPIAGTYTLNVYRGSATTPITLEASQSATFDNNSPGSWQTIHLATPVATNNTQPIWIAFHTDDIPYPAASCDYMGDSNSYLITTNGGNSWLSFATATNSNTYQSWMIRALLSNSASTSVIIDGPTSVGVNMPVTFTVAGPSGATYNWTLTGASHTAISGNTATATWTTPGTYNIIVTANNDTTVLSDTLSVSVSGNYYTVTVVSDNSEMGGVSGGGTFLNGTVTTIAATAYSGYHFVQWNDGNTDTIRTITVTADTTYIAYFEATAQYYTITVLSADETMGTVSGNGIYQQGETATITAIPYEGYQFSRWNDGVTDNPRTLVVTADATFIANFTTTQGIDEASTDILITTMPGYSVQLIGVENRTVEVYDMMGRRLLSQHCTDNQSLFQLPTAGVYLVVVDKTTAQRVVLIR